MSLEVLAPGQLTTVQDRGRVGWAGIGVGRAGALDGFSSAIANLLVGNPQAAAVLEVSFTGPRLRLRRGVQVALCGAPIDTRYEGTTLPCWRPLHLPAGGELRLGACRGGARAYLAVSGGFIVRNVLGSASTDLRGGFGGIAGRPLRRGDVLDVGAQPPPCSSGVGIVPWWIDPAPELEFTMDQHAGVLPGASPTEAHDALFGPAWTVHADSNRQGLRLEGPQLATPSAAEWCSEPIVPGTIQLPPDGRPIILLADAQTIGGYPVIGHVRSADLPRLAQLRPGARLHLHPATLADAQAALRRQRQQLARIDLAIRARQDAP